MNKITQSLLVLMALLLSSPTWAQSPGSEPEALHPRSLKSEGTWCTGDVLLDQAPNLSFSFWSESTCNECGVPQQVLADDFSVARDSMITEIVLWGWYFPNNAPPPVETWTVLVREGDGGLPGPVLSTQVLVPVSRTATGRSAEILGVMVDEYRWLLRLAEPVRASAPGAFYWIEAFHDSPVANADTSIELADVDEERGRDGHAVSSDAAPSAGEWFGAGGQLAMQVCGVRSEWHGLTLPGFEIDTGDPQAASTIFAVRNTSGETMDINVAYFGDNLSDGPLREDTVPLAAHQTYSHNIRGNLAGLDPDEDGIASGFAVISQAGGGAADLVGDALRVDFGNDFATGERLLAFDDFCSKQEVRFVEFGSGAEFNVVLRDPPDSGASMEVTVYNEAGDEIGTTQRFDQRQVQRIPISELVAGQSFGTLIFDFGASAGGIVTARYSAFGRFSTEIRGVCRAE